MTPEPEPTKAVQSRPPGPAGAAAGNATSRMLALQRQAGNRAVLAMLAAPAVPPLVRNGASIQRDDVVEGQTDPGDLVSGAPELTEALGSLPLWEMGGDGGEDEGGGGAPPNP